MSRWNPSNPTLAGDEWYGSAAAIQQLAASVGRGPRINSNASESVTAIAALIRKVTGTAPVLGIVDVYDLANPVIDAKSWALALPVSNASTPSGWQELSGGTQTPYDSTAYTFVDDVVLPTSDLQNGRSTQLIFPGTTSTSKPILFHAGSTFVDGDTGAGGASITSKRIAAVEVLAVGFNESGHSVQLIGELNIGGVSYAADNGPLGFSANSPMKMLRFAWYQNPATGLPWTNADAVALTNGTDAFGISLTIKSGGQNLRITALMLQFQVLTERRVATGFEIASAPDEWISIALLDPADNTSQAWSKLNNHDYLLLFTTTRTAGPGGISQVDTSTVADLPAQPLTDTEARVYTLGYGATPLALASTVDAQIPALLYVGSAVSADSLPYGSVVVREAGASGAIRKQGINTHSSQTYGTAKLLVSRGSGGQDAGLVVRLKKTSDNSVLAGPVTIAAADVPADGKFHVVSVRFPAGAALTAGTAVYVEAQSTSTVSWLLPALITRTSTISSSDGVSVDAADAGIGGAADKGDADTTSDYPWAIGLTPTPPGTLASSALTIANRPTFAVKTVPGTIGYAHLTWAATSLGGAFGYYEIQRGGVSIAIITTESSTFFNDIECARNVALAYRIRVVRADGGYSDWANFPAVTIPTVSKTDVVVASNWDPALALAFADVTEGPHEWHQRVDDRSVTKEYYGRDYPVVWAPPERSGEQFSRDLLYAVQDDNLVPGGSITPDRALFDLPLALFQASTVPCLVYCDGWGRRWNVSIACTPRATGPYDGAYIAAVTCTQVAVPDPVEVSVPWSP